MNRFWKSILKFSDPDNTDNIEENINKIFFAMWLAAIISLSLTYNYLLKWPVLEFWFIRILISLSGFVVVLLVHISIFQPLQWWLEKKYDKYKGLIKEDANKDTSKDNSHK